MYENRLCSVESYFRIDERTKYALANVVRTVRGNLKGKQNGTPPLEYGGGGHDGRLYLYVLRYVFSLSTVFSSYSYVIVPKTSYKTHIHTRWGHGKCNIR